MTNRTYAERSRIRDKIDLAVKTTVTYLRKSSNALYWDSYRPISPGYWALLDQALLTAADVVEELPDDFFEDRPLGDPFGLVSAMGGDASDRFNMSDESLERAEKVVELLRSRRGRTLTLRMILALENTTGRTDAEAEMFRAKAAELRKKHGIE